MGSLPTPWWERFTYTSDVTPSATCSTHTVLRTSCKVEYNEQGVPIRRCERLLEKFRRCPGKPEELVESLKEHFEEELPTSSLPTSSGQTPSTDLDLSQGQVIGSNPGQAIEEFIASFAADVLSSAAEKYRHDHEQQQQEDRGLHGFFSKLFKRPAVEGQGDKNNKKRKAWEDYAKDFQEV